MLGLPSLKPLWSRLRRSPSSESKPQARAGSRTAKPLTLNTIAAAAVSEDSLPFAEPKSPRGAPKQPTGLPFNITPLGDKIESKKATKGTRRNGGSNDASSGSARTSSLLVPPEMSPGKGNRSRKPSRSNTPTSSPPTSPETKKENLASGNKSRDPSASNTPTSSPPTSPETKKENLASGKQSANTSPHTSPFKLHVWPFNSGPSPETQTPALPKETLGIKNGPAPSLLENPSGDKQARVQSTTPSGSDTTTPAHSPETQGPTLATETLVNKDGTAPSLPGNSSGSAETKDEQARVQSTAPPASDNTSPTPSSPQNLHPTLPKETLVIRDGTAPSLPGNPSGPAELKDEQGPVQSIRVTPPGDTTTPPPPPGTQNTTSPMEAPGQTGKDDPAPSLPENASASAEIEGEQGFVQSTTPSGSDNTTPAPSSETRNSTLPTETLVIRHGSAALPSSKS